MKTPTAILIGLALIAAAIFFREPSVRPAHAALVSADGFSCAGSRDLLCGILNGDFIHFVDAAEIHKVNWKTGRSSKKKIKK